MTHRNSTPLGHAKSAFVRGATVTGPIWAGLSLVRAVASGESAGTAAHRAAGTYVKSVATTTIVGTGLGLALSALAASLDD